jgi:HAD superfamily hydrolase (TIGR01509 family)
MSQKSQRLYLKGVLVDFGDTLAYIDKKNNRRYTEGLLSILRNYGYQKNLSDLASSLDKAYYVSSRGETSNFWEFWESLLKDSGMPREPALIKELEESRKLNYTIFRLHKGTVSVLSSLREKYKLALVSNCAVGLSNIIEALGLTSFFAAIVLSYEVGVRKPDKRIYLKALQSVKLRPDECVFVSDEISDLEGAREVGLKTFLIRQGSLTTYEAKDPNFKPDFQCNHISEITESLLPRVFP